VRLVVPKDGKSRAADEAWNQGFGALYCRFWPVVYARCRRLLSSAALAEDAAQEIFVKLIADQSELPPGEEAVRWIQRVATNYCFNYLRNERRRQQARATLDTEVASYSDNVADRELVRRVIAGLPEEVGLIAWLNHVDELDQSDIAARLHISRRTVVARLADFSVRARRMLGTL
jgi:RNA polymerase sigma-70 factor, ECF subfamily